MFVTLQHLVVFVKLQHCFFLITWQGWFVFDILQKCVYITLDNGLCSSHVTFGNVYHIVMLVYFLHIATWRYVWHNARIWICSSHCDVKLFIEMWCYYVCHIAMTGMCSSNCDGMAMFVTLWCHTIFYIMMLLCSLHCDITIFVTLQHYYVCHIATSGCVCQITTLCFVHHMTWLVCVWHIRKMCVHHIGQWDMFVTWNVWKCLSLSDVSIFSSHCNMKICLTHCEDKDMLITLQ